MFTRTSLRRRLIALGAVTVILGVLVPVTPAAAEAPACPDTIPSAGYRDLGGLSTEIVDAIDCITYYGISEGVTSTLFDPAGLVPRWQMALFLTRMATDLGITLPSGSNQGFTDLAAVSTPARTAINQLAQLGITKGVTPTSFAPFDAVPRWQMALFLTRLYTRAGFTPPSGSFQGFTDIAEFPMEAWKAINQLAQLNVAHGMTTSLFGPYGNVYRWQMALFLARQLQACHAQPLQVTLTPSATASSTSGAVQLMVTVRNHVGTPVPNRYVDVFVGTVDAAGRCALDSDAAIGGSDAGTGSNCKLDTKDPRTNSAGQTTVTVSHSSLPEVDTVYAWVGDLGQTFDIDRVLAFATSQIQWTLPVVRLDLQNATVEYGKTARVDARLLGAGGLAVPLAGERIVFRVSRDGSEIINQAILTSANGVATLSYTGPSDPTVGDDPTEIDTVVAFWDRDRDGVDDGIGEFDDTATVTWDDASPRADVFTFAQSSSSSLRGSQVTLTMKVTDKFGVTYGNVRVNFRVTGANPATWADDTDSTGIALVTYTPSNSGVDTVDAWIDFDRDGNVDPEDLDFGDVPKLTHYVVQAAPTLSGASHVFDLLGVDAQANAVDVIELGAGSLYRLYYDQYGDLFSVDGHGASLSGFESALLSLDLPKMDGAGGVQLTTNTYTTTTSGSSAFILETS